MKEKEGEGEGKKGEREKGEKENVHENIVSGLEYKINKISQKIEKRDGQ